MAESSPFRGRGKKRPGAQTVKGKTKGGKRGEGEKFLGKRGDGEKSRVGGTFPRSNRCKTGNRRFRRSK